MFYRLKNENELLDWADYMYASDCLETNIITQEELDENPQKIIIQNGKLIINPNWGEMELKKTKEGKIAENDIARDVTLNKGVVYKNVLFDSDTDQKVNLLAIISTIDDEQTIVWYGKDNLPLECNKEDLLNIGTLITQLHSFCWNKNAEIKTAINQANTTEEVQEIDINYEREVNNVN